MERLTPLMRISAGLVALTCSILIGLDWVGIVPTERERLLESRVQLAESLVTQVAASISAGEFGSTRAVLAMSVRRNPDIESAGIRDPSGRLLFASESHAAGWLPEEEGGAHQISAPLFRNGKRWATLELRFAELASPGILAALWERPLVKLLLLTSVIGFATYLLYMRRTLRHLDPSAVVPPRVQAALDVMAEGVLLIDVRESIVLANRAFCELSGRSSSGLLGRSVSSLGWRRKEGESGSQPLPWLDVLRSDLESARTTLLLHDESRGTTRVFDVTAAPVRDGWGRPKGAIVTFDDTTELERKRLELQKAMTELEKSRDEIRMQNEELQLLARRDPLTGVANRRAFMQGLDQWFPAANTEGRSLACVMVDVDFFKRVNDDHGHAVGDAVIRRVAEALVDVARSPEYVCRYGGEEFCLLLPDTTPEEAVEVAELVRGRVASPGFTQVPVTASFGVACNGFGAPGGAQMIEQADAALYASKEGGRNRVTRWDQIPAASKS